MGKADKNKQFCKTLAGHKLEKPNFHKQLLSERVLGRDAIAYQLDRKGTLKLFQELSKSYVET